jgi:hypothetical protein
LFPFFNIFNFLEFLEFSISFFSFFSTVRNKQTGSWTGTHNKLNRLKFQGAVKVLLKLNMNWQQFDAAFRAISTNADGTIQEDEFVAAFRSSAELADLLKNAHQKVR